MHMYFKLISVTGVRRAGRVMEPTCLMCVAVGGGVPTAPHGTVAVRRLSIVSYALVCPLQRPNLRVTVVTCAALLKMTGVERSGEARIKSQENCATCKPRATGCLGVPPGPARARATQHANKFNTTLGGWSML